MVKIKKKGAKTLKEYNDSVPRNADRKLDLVLYNDKLKMFERLNNATGDKVDNLLKKKNIAEFNKIRLIAEDLNREKKQKEYSIYQQTFEKLQSDIEKSKGLLYDLKQDIKTVSEHFIKIKIKLVKIYLPCHNGVARISQWDGAANFNNLYDIKKLYTTLLIINET